MPNQKKFYFVLVSEDAENKLYPNSFRGKKLGDFLHLLDEMMSGTMKSQLGEDFGGLRIESISRGSTCVACSSTPKVEPAFISVADQINTGKYLGGIKPALKKIEDFGSEFNARLELRRHKSGPAVATIRPKAQRNVTMRPQTIQTTTTLYGKISGINGMPKTKVTLSALLGFSGMVSFHVSGKEMRRLACGLYGQTVGVVGTATINMPERAIAAFSFTKFTDYREKPLSEGIKRVREKFGQYFDAIEDINAFVEEQRG